LIVYYLISTRFLALDKLFSDFWISQFADIILLPRAHWLSHSAQLKLDIGDDKIVITSYIGAPVCSGVGYEAFKIGDGDGAVVDLVHVPAIR